MVMKCPRAASDSGKSTMLHAPIRCIMLSRRDIDFLMELAVSRKYFYTIANVTNCPTDYGNEVEAGQGVARAIKEGLVKREDLFIISKLWNSFHEGHQVEPICKK